MCTEVKKLGIDMLYQARGVQRMSGKRNDRRRDMMERGDDMRRCRRASGGAEESKSKSRRVKEQWNNM
jgi:hypothetical protein